jgi:hypothetical protein
MLGIGMYALYIDGSWKNNYQTVGEAMKAVDTWARPYKKSWKILDEFKRVYSQG